MDPGPRTYKKKGGSRAQEKYINKSRESFLPQDLELSRVKTKDSVIRIHFLMCCYSVEHIIANLCSDDALHDSVAEKGNLLFTS